MSATCASFAGEYVFAHDGWPGVLTLRVSSGRSLRGEYRDHRLDQTDLARQYRRCRSRARARGGRPVAINDDILTIALLCARQARSGLTCKGTRPMTGVPEQVSALG